MKKGFGKVKKSKTESFLERQIEGLCQLALADKSIFYLLDVEKKNIKPLRKVTHAIAQKYPQIFLMVNSKDPATLKPVLLIARKQLCESGSSYAWLKKSERSGKWLVMANPPGAKDCRCLCVFQDEQQAREIAISIEPAIASMSLSDWHNKKDSYQELLKSLPEDDDGIIGLISLETGEIVDNDPVSYEATSEILKKARTTEMEPEDLRAALREHIPYLPD